MIGNRLFHFQKIEKDDKIKYGWRKMSDFLFLEFILHITVREPFKIDENQWYHWKGITLYLNMVHFDFHIKQFLTSKSLPV